MTFYVLGPDGSKYGPADMTVLQQWVDEGRILPETMLETDTGVQGKASALRGLVFPATVAAPSAPPAVAAAPIAPTVSAPGYTPGAPTPGPAYTPGAPYSGNAPAYTQAPADDAIWVSLGGIGFAIASFLLTYFIGFLGLFCWISGISMSWRSRESRPAIAYAGLALNVLAAVFWVYWRFVRGNGTR